MIIASPLLAEDHQGVDERDELTEVGDVRDREEDPAAQHDAVLIATAMYIDAMQQIYGNVTKVIIESRDADTRPRITIKDDGGKTRKVSGTNQEARYFLPIGANISCAEGDRVVMAGTPLVEVGDPASLEVVCDILSRDASQVAVGMPMEVRSAGRAPMMARVLRVEPAAFTKRSALGVDEQRVNVIAAFDQPVGGLGDEIGRAHV